MDKPLILVVDDNHINRLFFESSLKKINCEVQTAEDGFKAIELCHKIQFDLILMDIRMNGMNGIEAASQIHQTNNNSQTSIVAISAEIFQIEHQTDFVDSLLKPVKQAALSQIITQYTQNICVFNNAKALSITHHDKKIVLNLRQMFIAQLQDKITLISDLFQRNEFKILQHELHQLLGSATICAAELLVDAIQKFSIDIKSADIKQQQSYQQLIYAINLTINSMTEKLDN